MNFFSLKLLKDFWTNQHFSNSIDLALKLFGELQYFKHAAFYHQTDFISINKRGHLSDGYDLELYKHLDPSRRKKVFSKYQMNLNQLTHLCDLIKNKADLTQGK